MVPEIARPTAAEEAKMAVDRARERRATAIGDALADLFRPLLHATAPRRPLRPTVPLLEP
jgi:hypothetical protein